MKTPLTHDNHNQSQATRSDHEKIGKKHVYQIKERDMHMQSPPMCPTVCSICRKYILGNHSPLGSLKNTINTQIEVVYYQNMSFRKVNIKYSYMRVWGLNQGS